MKKIKYKKITEILNNHSIEYKSSIDNEEVFNSINSILNAKNNELTFFSNKLYLNQLSKTNAKACLISKDFASYLPETCMPIIVSNPYYALACISEIYSTDDINDHILSYTNQFKESQLIDNTCKISPHVTINSSSIINENGDLVAIAVSGLAKDQTEGINFGIKSSAAETFLRSNKINPKKSMYSGIKDNDKLLEILEQGTVYTYCD